MDEQSDSMSLDERLRRVGALMAVGAIRAVLRERSKQSGDSNAVKQDDPEGQEGADGTNPVSI